MADDKKKDKDKNKSKKINLKESKQENHKIPLRNEGFDEHCQIRSMRLAEYFKGKN